MDEDVPVDPDAPETIQWRRDASTSRLVRLLWSLGVGTFFAMIAIIAFWRLYDIAAQAGAGSVVVAAVGAIAVTIIVLAVDPRAERRLERVADALSISVASERSLERAVDATVGTLVMAVVIGGLMGIGRLVSQGDLLGGVGAGPFTLLAAFTLPAALLALVLASFLSSRGALDTDDGVLYLADPDHAIDLEVIVGVSSRAIGDAAIVGLTYAQPGGQYVPGPRRIVVPREVADEVERAAATA